MTRHVEYIQSIIDDPRQRPEYADIPVWMLYDLRDYIETHVPPSSGFLRAVLENNLNKTLAHADDMSIAALPALVKLVFNHAPGDCWGSKDAVVGYAKDGV